MHIWVQNAKMSVMKTLISSLGNSTEIHDYQSCQLPHSVEAKIHHIKRSFSKIVVSVCSGSRHLSPEVLKNNIQKAGTVNKALQLYDALHFLRIDSFSDSRAYPEV